MVPSFCLVMASRYPDDRIGPSGAGVASCLLSWKLHSLQFEIEHMGRCAKGGLFPSPTDVECMAESSFRGGAQTGLVCSVVYSGRETLGWLCRERAFASRVVMVIWVVERLV